MVISKKKFRIIFLLMLVLFFIVSSVPNGTLNRSINSDFVSFRFDYLLHFIAYIFIGIMASLAYSPNWKILLFLLVFALAEEGHQYWVPFRTLNPIDYFFDALGVFVGVGILFLKKRIVSD